MKALLIVGLISVVCGGVKATVPDCELTTAALMRYESELLKATQKYAEIDEPKFNQLISKPLLCIINIHEKADGSLKYMANSFMRALLGGGQSKGLMRDKRYEMFATKMKSADEKTADPVRKSLAASHAKGAWDFYKGFCDKEHEQYCPDFLPPEDLIGRQSPLLGASSMILLRQAYFVLDGKSREIVGERIKNLHLLTPQKEILKRRVIDQIYRELFPDQMPPLSLLLS